MQLALQFVWVVIAFVLFAYSAAMPKKTLASGVILDPNSFPSLGPFTVSSGSILFDTTTGVFYLNGNPQPGSGVVNANNSALTAFTFDSLTISPGVNITYQGNYPLALLSKGNIMLEGNLSADKLGSAGGGSLQNGQGVGGGNAGAHSSNDASGGGGGGFGGIGANGGNAGLTFGGAGGSTYGSTDLSALSSFIVGSGGGGGYGYSGPGGKGGAGGGGIVLIALGTINLDSANVTSNGENTAGPLSAPSSNSGYGGGSGGAIMIVAPAYADTGATIRAKGGSAFNSNASPNVGGGGGGGGGGRITFVVGTSPGATIQVSGGVGGSGNNTGGNGGTGSSGTMFQRSFITLIANTPLSTDVAMPMTATLVVGNASSYDWNFGDGNMSSTLSNATSHVYHAGGIYTVTVTATMSATNVTTSSNANVTIMPEIGKVFLPLIMR